ncbi:hypothetical protein [Xylocopilactobacillus apicola]|uniref:Uncharacterized protein n=1 Tax=Xylocopilactobacillus apicola TaxID=2932184 RepID=A0AAU9D716_9LACO|nr:hypothetical protein [Xylocopilactobacillus apicola]BDR58100.1 hypothetical protein XA3_05410 [Xylocopilactobacillus apicola]
MKKKNLFLSVFILVITVAAVIYFFLNQKTGDVLSKKPPEGVFRVNENQLREMQKEAAKEGQTIEIHGGPLDNMGGK